jgi:uncharacterized membrane protein YfcA
VVEVGSSADVHPEAVTASSKMAARTRSIVATIAYTRPMPRLLLAALIGLAGGIMSGLFGIGGGLVFVPGMVLFLRLDQHRAHATSSFAVVFTSMAGALRFVGGGAADIGVGLLLATGAIAGAFVGASSMGRISPRWLKTLFALVAIVAAVKLFLDASIDTRAVQLSLGLAIAVVLVGAATGALASMLGLGGGLVYVPGLSLILGFAQRLAQGTSLVAIVPTQLTAAMVHLRAGRVDRQVGLALGTTGIIGALVGAQLAFTLSVPDLRRAFAVLLVVAAILQARNRP